MELYVLLCGMTRIEINGIVLQFRGDRMSCLFDMCLFRYGVAVDTRRGNEIYVIWDWIYMQMSCYADMCVRDMWL